MLQNKSIRLIIVAGLVVLSDQITKALVTKYLPLHKNIPVIAGFFDITHILNPGGAFGLMANMSVVVRTVVFLASAFALIFGGAIGNLIDRVRFGVVVDFLDFYLGKYHWPAFNIADSAITVGIFIFIYHLLFKKMPED
jgi:signal peptidase II